MMIIKELTASQLNAFIDSEEYENLKNLPISRHRALSQIHNPRAEKEDVLLLLCYIENELVGYLGVLPDIIYLKEKEEKAGWLTCLWVHENYRGKGIAKKLLNQALTVWNNKILATEFTPEAKALYDSSGLFNDLVVSKGMRGYLRFNLQEILPPKKSFFKKNKIALKALDNCLNIFNDVRLLLWKKHLNNKVEYVNEIDEELSQFLNLYQAENFTKRGAKELNWIIKNPWILTSSVEDSYSIRYHFSSVNKRFEVLNMKLYDENKKLTAFIMLMVKGNEAKVPYCFCEEEFLKNVADVIYQHLLEMKLNMITVFYLPLSHYLLNDTHSPFILKKEMKRHYLISSAFGDLLPDKINLQDGDGDCAFT